MVEIVGSVALEGVEHCCLVKLIACDDKQRDQVGLMGESLGLKCCRVRFPGWELVG